jgi:hypothetical protein
MFRHLLLVCNNQGEERDSLARPRRHFQHTVTPDVEGPLEVAHIVILLGIDSRVGEEDFEIALVC